MIKNKKIINIVNFPGSGTHFLMDIMAILGFPHNPVLDIIVKIIKLKNDKNLKYSDLNIKRKNLFKKIHKKILQNNSLNNAESFSKILQDEILNKISKSSFIMMPQIFYEGNNYNLSMSDLNFIKQVFLNLDNQNQQFSTIVYLRHPNDILNSKMKRFFKKNESEKFENEINQIISFYNFNQKDIEIDKIKYEDLIKNKAEAINKISKIMNVGNSKKLFSIKEFYIYKSSKGYKKLYNFDEKIKFLSNIYSNEYLVTEKENLIYIKKNIDQFKIIYSYLVKKNYYNDGAFHRSEKTIFAKIFVKILLLFPKINLNYKKLTSVKFREKNKNIITGI